MVAKKLSILFLFVLCFNCTPPEVKKPIKETQATKPANVILLIGDGMGLTQLSSSFYFGTTKPNFSRFKSIGLSNVIAANSKITDSASGATAFASGIKTYNGAIGVDMDKIQVETIVEVLSKEGYATGLISTSSITHATPASFYAHVENRNQEEAIAAQMSTSTIDFFAGGGLKFFKKRKDGTNLLTALTSNGFIVNTTELSSSLEVNKKYGFLLADEGMPKMIEGRGPFLSEATQLALNYFELQEKPFFLMIESSQIDWGGHDNKADYLIKEVLDFDDVIGKVLDFAEERGNTLVIVTADHETGGFSLSPEVIGKNPKGEDIHDYNRIHPTFSTSGHSATLIPVLAFGPQSELFIGFYENNDIYYKMRAALGK